MNSWSFTGNLGADAETRTTQSGDAVVNFSVGVKSGYGDKATTTWARCSMFGKRGQAVAQYLLKGQLVGVTGEMSVREYQKKDGTAGFSVDVRVDGLTLLGKKDSGAQFASPDQAAPAAPAQRAPAPSGDVFDPDDIPF